ncbi:MAG: hypothetical protein H6719_17865 [Sandaracinaceae bacterium]|nr:hypothetical protein [Sandaracinaceae bacterium]
MATCSGGACGFACEPGFDRDGAGCRPSRCGNGMLDMGEACDDGNGVAGDGCSESCAMESTATGTCPGAEIWLSGTRQHYTGDTRGQASTIRCSSTAAGPDAIFTIHTAWSGNLRIHLHPRGPWDATLNTRPSCPITGESYLCVDSGGGGADEQIFGGVFADGVYSVVVSGYRGGDAGSFEIWFEAG